MGLAAVLGIVRAHQGIITVESKVDLGSTFRFYFPVLEKEIPQIRETAPPAPRFSGHGTVLVVEDEAMVRQATAGLIASLGFSVVTAKDGVEAVEMFLEHRNKVRCVLCVLSMPRMDGWETLNALREIAPGFPVILASGYSVEQVMEGEHTETPQAYLTKPYRRESLCEAFRKALPETDNA
jgi:CheY-like chemotaxis protein